MPFSERTRFKADPANPPGEELSARDKNSNLAQLLEGPWNGLQIVKVERIEIGSEQGWRVTFRQ